MLEKTKIKDVAEKTGLSITTVSRVLNGKAEDYRISKKTKETIEKAANELNYIPNKHAANLRSGKSNTLGLILPSLINPFFSKIASLINTEVNKQGYNLIISDSNEDIKAEKQALNQLISLNIEGLIMIPSNSEKDHIEHIQDKGLPVILIDRYFEDGKLPFVSTDNYLGATMATEHLLEYGHNCIACIQGVQTSTPNKLRVKGFSETMRNAGLHSYMIAGDEFSIQNGYLQTKLLLQKKQRPTAIFTLSNTIALGCLQALKEENLKVPEDISIITFDDHPYLDFLSTPISCIKQPVDNICMIALKFLFSKLNGERDFKDERIILRPEIKYRESVRRIKTNNI